MKTLSFGIAALGIAILVGLWALLPEGGTIEIDAAEVLPAPEATEVDADSNPAALSTPPGGSTDDGEARLAVPAEKRLAETATATEGTETVEVEDTSAVFLVGRIVDGAGTPLANLEWGGEHVSRGKGSGTTMPVTFTTGPEGRFRIRGQEFRAVNATATLIVVHQSDAGTPAWQAEAVVPSPVRRGRNDLGDLVARPPAPLASGHVVDSSGEAVPDAKVMVHRALFVGRDGVPAHWAPQPNLTTTTDHEGRFAMYGRAEDTLFPDEARLRTAHAVVASHPRFADSRRVEFARGAVNVTLVVHRPGRITGSVLTDGRSERRAIQLLLQRDDDLQGASSKARTFDDTRFGSMHSDGSFVFDRLAPGWYSLLVGLEGGRVEIERIAAVRVDEGETTEDPRLQGIDLRGGLHEFTVSVQDVDGRALDARLFVRAVDDPGAEPDVHRARAGEPAVFASPHALLHVTVRSEGFRTEVLEALADDATVTLRRGLPVKIVLADPTVLPDASLYVLQARARSKERVRDWIEPSFAFSAAGEARLLVPAPGQYDLAVSVRRSKQGEFRQSFGVRSADSPTLEVRDVEHEQTFTVSVSRQAIESTIDSYFERP